MGIEGWVINLNKILEERAISKAKLAEKSGLSESYISRLCKGHYKDLEERTLNKLAGGLFMPANELREKLFNGYFSTRDTSLEELVEEAQLAIHRLKKRLKEW